MAAALSTSLLIPPLPPKPKPTFLQPLQFAFSPLTLSTHSLSPHQPFSSIQSRPRLRISNSGASDSVSSPATADAAGELVSATADSSGDGVSIVISLLLFVAFIGLSILTVGVIYLAVTDFLQKRERDKLDKEEASKKKRGGKKARVRSRTGPRGFGQKIEEDEDF